MLAKLSKTLEKEKSNLLLKFLSINFDEFLLIEW
jgi:hypothetical protein